MESISNNNHPHHHHHPRHPHSHPPAQPIALSSMESTAKDTSLPTQASSPFLPHKTGDEDSFHEGEDETHEERMRRLPLVGKVVVGMQQTVKRSAAFVNVRSGGCFFPGIALLLYLAYFTYAMYYRFGDEGSVRLLWCTVLGILIASRHKAWRVLSNTRPVRWCLRPKTATATRRLHTLRFFIRWLLYGCIGAFMGHVIVTVAMTDPQKLSSLPGIFVFLLICFLFSSHPDKVDWHTIYWSLGLQFILGVVVMRWEGGKGVVLWIQTRLDSFFSNSKPASILLFGETYTDHYLVFGAVPIVFLTNSALSMLYHVGAMQFVVKVIGNSLHFVLDTSPIESTGVAASIFMEGASALLAIRPYLGGLTKSELFALTTACLASIGGAFLAILSQLGVSVEFMLPAMVISAPATFAVCKLAEPETRQPKKVSFDGDLPPDMQYSSILDAAQAGAIGVVSLVANIVVSAFSLFSLLAWINSTLTWFGDRVGIQQLTLEVILSYIFFPFSYLMGIAVEDCRQVAMLMGLRVSSSSFISILKMQSMAGNRAKFEQYSLLPNATVTYLGDHIVLDLWNTTLIDGFISRRSEAIATYALCGFSGILSVFIMLSILGTLLPKRRAWLAKMVIPLLVTGNLANFMCGCFAGMLADI